MEMDTIIRANKEERLKKQELLKTQPISKKPLALFFFINSDHVKESLKFCVLTKEIVQYTLSKTDTVSFMNQLNQTFYVVIANTLQDSLVVDITKNYPEIDIAAENLFTVGTEKVILLYVKMMSEILNKCYTSVFPSAAAIRHIPMFKKNDIAFKLRTYFFDTDGYVIDDTWALDPTVNVIWIAYYFEEMNFQDKQWYNLCSYLVINADKPKFYLTESDIQLHNQLMINPNDNSFGSKFSLLFYLFPDFKVYEINEILKQLEKNNIDLKDFELFCKGVGCTGVAGLLIKGVISQEDPLFLINTDLNSDKIVNHFNDVKNHYNVYYIEKYKKVYGDNLDMDLVKRAINATKGIYTFEMYKKFILNNVPGKSQPESFIKLD